MSDTPKLDAALAELARAIAMRMSEVPTVPASPDALEDSAIRRLNFTLRLHNTLQELEITRCK